MNNKKIVDEVIIQLQEDFGKEYLEAIEELLYTLLKDKDSKEALVNYLPEYVIEELKKEEDDNI